MSVRLLGFLERRPFATGVLCAGCKGALADLSGQAMMTHAYNPKQTLAFALWNTFYCGFGVYILYSVLFPRYWPLVLSNGAKHPHALLRTAGMVAFDNLIATPFLCLPTYYLCAFGIEQGREGLRRPRALAQAALSRYRSEARETIGLSLALWIPIHSITFSTIPVPLRVHWTAAMSFLTLTCMSLLQQTLATRRGGRVAACDAS